MRFGTPIYQRSYNKRYNPLRGRKILLEQTGFFKEAARSLGISGLLGIDPISESGLGLNRTVNTKLNGNGILSDFINRYQGTPKEKIHFTDDNHIKIGESPLSTHKIYKKGNAYYIKTHNNSLTQHTVPLRINAKDNNEFISKLALIFTNVTTRAKLEYHKPSFPVITSPMQIMPFADPRIYVYLNDTKIIPNGYLQEFESGNNYAKINEFDTALGSASIAQINYHNADSNQTNYSPKKNDESFTPVVDLFGVRLNNMTEHLLSSNVSDELMGNIVSMYDVQKKLSSQQRTQLARKLCEDYVYNIKGKGTVNNRQRSHAPANYTHDPAIDSVWAQFQFDRNPFRGGRSWREIPFALEQTLLAFYAPTASGKRICKYDIDPKKFTSEIRKQKVTAPDRQFMPAYGRKILGTYVTLKMLNDEIALIDLKDTKNATKNYKKWADLNNLHDELFEAAGDMRDFLRKHSTGFSQTKDGMSKKIPDLSDNPQKETLEKIAFDNKDFVKHTTENLLWHIKDYTYFENFMGWHIREDLGGFLPKKFMTDMYQKKMPPIIADVATTMLIEGLDNISRELKYIETNLQRDVNGKGRLNTLMEKFKFGDINGFNEFLEWDKNSLLKGLQGEVQYPSSHKQALQAEGVIMEKPFFPPMRRPYGIERTGNIVSGENQGFFVANAPATRVCYQYIKKMSNNFIDFMQVCAMHFKKIQTEMQKDNISDMYQTKSIKEFDTMLRDTAKKMATEYLHDKRVTYSVLEPKELERLHFEIQKKMYHFLQLTSNISALLANNPDVVYQ